MPDLVQRDPFRLMERDFGNLRRMMDRFFDDSFFRLPGWATSDEGTLPLDVFEKDNHVVVKASLPGFRKDDIDIQLDNGVLYIKAQRSEESEEKDAHYYRRERTIGAVSRRVALPGIPEDADVDATLEDGVLTVSIPMPGKPRPKQIPIRSAGASGSIETTARTEPSGDAEQRSTSAA